MPPPLTAPRNRAPAFGGGHAPTRESRRLAVMILENQAYTWFSKVIIFGELPVGLGLLFGALTGFAAGGILDTAFMFAGSLSSNPLLRLLEILIVWA